MSRFTRQMIEIVHLRRAGPIAGEEKGDQPVQSGIIGHISGGEVPFRPNRLGWKGAGPILTQQRSLSGALARIAGGKTETVAGGEEERGGGVTTQ